MDKSPDAFRTISEVADDLDLPQHVLRFWETRFSQIKPLKRGGGRRYYRPEDVDLLKGIRHLLYEEGYTIRGVQRILKEQGNRFVIGIGSGETAIGDLATSGPVEPVAPAPPPEPARTPKQAVTVGELHEGRKSSRGLLGKLTGAAAEPGPQADLRLTMDDRRSLQSTLYELLECKRLLDQVRSN